MPSSMTSAPAASSRLRASAVVARSGSPAVMYGMKATLRCMNLIQATPQDVQQQRLQAVSVHIAGEGRGARYLPSALSSAIRSLTDCGAAATAVADACAVRVTPFDRMPPFLVLLSVPLCRCLR